MNIPAGVVRRRPPPPPPEEVDDVGRGGPAFVRLGGGGREVTAGPAPVGQRAPRRVVLGEGQRAGAGRRRVPEVVHHRLAAEAAHGGDPTEQTEDRRQDAAQRGGQL